MKQPTIKYQPLEKCLKNFKEVSLGIGKKQAVEEAGSFPQFSDLSKYPQCPLGVDIAQFIRLLRENNPKAALAVINEAHDMPGICGRVCSAPCERELKSKVEDKEIEIRELERFCADHGRTLKTGKRPDGIKVAVVGAGPAGLMASAQLAKRGFSVTIFEALPIPGGKLAYSFPSFRLPADILDKEVESIKKMGVVIETSTIVGKNLTVKEIFDRKFEIILLAIGNGTLEIPSLKNLNMNQVYFGQELLWKLNFSHRMKDIIQPPLPLSSKVIVVGGGSAALDCARAIRRFGRDVTLVFETTEEEFKGSLRDRELAKKEGVRLEGLMRLEEILTDEAGDIMGIKCISMDYADPDSSGTWKLVPVPDTANIYNGQTIILVPPQRPNQTLLHEIHPDLKFNPDGTLWQNEGGMTSVENIFAAGDLAMREAQLIDVMVSGKRSADCIENFLVKKIPH